VGNNFIYGLNLSLCNLALYAQWTYGIHHKGLLGKRIACTGKKEARFLFLVSPAVYRCAIIISVWLPV
jgi:hypothetical protein